MATPRTPGTRAKDSDRVDICQVLDSALADGQLSMADHEHRVNAATYAATLGELQSLVADLQQANSAQSPAGQQSRLRRGPIVIAAIAGLAVAIGGAIAWAVMSDSGSTTNTTTAKPTAEAPMRWRPNRPPQLHTADGMAGLIDAMRKRFGDTMGYELAISPDEAMPARPDPADDRSKLIYQYHGGWGDPSDSPKSDTDDLADLAAFDVPAAVAALQTAPETLTIAPDDVSGSFIDIDHIADPNGPGALEPLVKITTKSDTNGFIYLDAASNIKRVEYPG